MRYAITDIHGCHKTFLKALKTIHLMKTDELFLLGDYVDRGPDSSGVIDTIWRLQSLGYNVTALRGNHEQMVLDYDAGLQKRYEWFPEPQKINRTLRWLAELPHYAETPGYVLVHAGLNFAGTDPLHDEESMLWIRRWYGDLDRAWLGDRIIVHGHTPQPVSETLTQLNELEYGRVLDIDTGCVYDRRGMGQLTVFNLDDRTLRMFPNVG